jgi:hypothetical protein
MSQEITPLAMKRSPSMETPLELQEWRSEAVVLGFPELSSIIKTRARK